MANGIIRHEGIPLPFNLNQINTTLILILACLLLFAFIYKRDFHSLKANLLSFISFRRDKHIRQERTISSIWYTYYLAIQFSVLSAISIYSILTHFNGNQEAYLPLRTIALLILLIIAFIAIKSIIYSLLGFIYNMKQQIALLKHWYILIIEVLGLVLFIPTLLLVYADQLHTEIAIFMLILFIIAQLILFSRLIVYFVREKLNFLFLIAYLCSVEIIPYLFLASWLIFLYKTDEMIVLW